MVKTPGQQPRPVYSGHFFLLFLGGDSNRSSTTSALRVGVVDYKLSRDNKSTSKSKTARPTSFSRLFVPGGRNRGRKVGRTEQEDLSPIEAGEGDSDDLVSTPVAAASRTSLHSRDDDYEGAVLKNSYYLDKSSYVDGGKQEQNQNYEESNGHGYDYDVVSSQNKRHLEEELDLSSSKLELIGKNKIGNEEGSASSSEQDSVEPWRDGRAGEDNLYYASSSEVDESVSDEREEQRESFVENTSPTSAEDESSDDDHHDDQHPSDDIYLGSALEQERLPKQASSSNNSPPRLTLKHKMNRKLHNRTPGSARPAAGTVENPSPARPEFHLRKEQDAEREKDNLFLELDHTRGRAKLSTFTPDVTFETHLDAWCRLGKSEDNFLKTYETDDYKAYLEAIQVDKSTLTYWSGISCEAKCRDNPNCYAYEKSVNTGRCSLFHVPVTWTELQQNDRYKTKDPNTSRRRYTGVFAYTGQKYTATIPENEPEAYAKGSVCGVKAEKTYSTRYLDALAYQDHWNSMCRAGRVGDNLAVVSQDGVAPNVLSIYSGVTSVADCKQKCTDNDACVAIQLFLHNAKDNCKLLQSTNEKEDITYTRINKSKLRDNQEGTLCAVKMSKYREKNKCKCDNGSKDEEWFCTKEIQMCASCKDTNYELKDNYPAPRQRGCEPKANIVTQPPVEPVTTEQPVVTKEPGVTADPSATEAPGGDNGNNAAAGADGAGAGTTTGGEQAGGSGTGSTSTSAGTTSNHTQDNNATSAGGDGSMPQAHLAPMEGATVEFVNGTLQQVVPEEGENATKEEEAEDEGDEGSFFTSKVAGAIPVWALFVIGGALLLGLAGFGVYFAWCGGAGHGRSVAAGGRASRFSTTSRESARPSIPDINIGGSARESESIRPRRITRLLTRTRRKTKSQGPQIKPRVPA
ncbi:unnamed protein product [Amoebophrya sp. A120]|nr:unnamed protein product [Amoebophrya sp. A120]|eukprot:GSA120T00013621001.1